MYLIFQQYRSGKQKNNKSNHKQALNNTTQISVELKLESLQWKPNDTVEVEVVKFYAGFLFWQNTITFLLSLSDTASRRHKSSHKIGTLIRNNFVDKKKISSIGNHLYDTDI